jgi:hypothetical protein
MAHKVKNQLDIASKLAMQTSDQRYMGKNYMQDFDTGFIAIHDENKPLTPLNNQSHDVPVMLNYLQLFKQQAREIGGSPESVTGQTMPSGTPYSLAAMLNQEAKGLFNMMTDNKGLHLEEMLRTYVIPHFKKTLKNTDELVAVLDGMELEEYDKLALPFKMQEEIMARLEVGHIPTEQELMMAIDEQNAESNVRVATPSKDKAKTWKEVFKDFEWDIDPEISGENRDKQAALVSLNSILDKMSVDPEAFSPEDRRKVMNMIINEVGSDIISPLQFKGVALQGTGQTGGIQTGASPQVGMPELTETL